MNQLLNKSNLLVIKEMRRQGIKVDHIITDPPYNISQKNNFETMGRQSIDFGDWDDNFDLTEWMNGIGEIVKPGGSVLIFNAWRNLGIIADKLEEEGFVVKDLIRWIKPNPMPRNIKRRYVSDFEQCIWAVKPGEKWIFNKPDDEPYLRPVIGGATAKGKNRIHPTQKSAEAIKRLIEVHTNEGDLIFDPFSGSGQISISALKLNRKYLACEIDEKYYNDSKERIENDTPTKKI